MQVIGKLHKVFETKEISDKFKQREIILQTDEQYPQLISIQFTQDKCDVLNGYKVGEQVEVKINLKGREWTNPQGEVKYFNTIQGWAISKLNNGHTQQSPDLKAQLNNNADEGDGLPF